jgi:hypothetical protein
MEREAPPSGAGDAADADSTTGEGLNDDPDEVDVLRLRRVPPLLSWKWCSRQARSVLPRLAAMCL